MRGWARRRCALRERGEEDCKQRLSHERRRRRADAATTTRCSARRRALRTPTPAPTTSACMNHQQPNIVEAHVREDWDNRELSFIISDHVKSIANFLSAFDLACRTQLAGISDRLTLLEKKIEYLEASVSPGDTLN